jgi:radical SAM protein with 4Fe4S-binding SPASM domain
MLAMNWRFLKKLTIRKNSNSLFIRILSFFHLPFTTRFPESVTIEPAAMCNLSCPECTIGNGRLLRAQGLMNPELFKQIVFPLKDYLVNCQFFFQGEPFLNPHLYAMVEYANQQKIFTSTSTNGHFLTPENCVKIVQSGLDRLLVSVDGTDQQTYGLYRQGGSLQKVIDGIGNLRHAREISERKNPAIIVQFLVFRHNEHQIKAIKHLAKKWGADDVVLKSIQVENKEEAEKLLPLNRHFSRYKKDSEGNYFIDKNYPVNCFRLRSIAVFTHEGEMLPCCYDKNGEFSIGNINEQPVERLWKKDRFMRFRKVVWRSKDVPVICRNCPEGLNTNSSH